jgi:hypothetical protein
MSQSYLISEEGVTKGMVFSLDSRLTIGRGEENHIRLTHSTVSRRHTLVYFENGEAIVRDMESRNGTFLNGERVNKAILSDGDVIWVGDVALRFVQTADQNEVNIGAETQEFTQSIVPAGLPRGDLPGRSPRLTEAISKVPFLSDLPQEQLAEVGQAANLRLVKQGTTIVREGDFGRSMYIIMEGKVRVLTQGNQGNRIHISDLGKSDFFGEISFLTAAPRFATVEAVVDTLICELKYESMKQVMKKSSAVKRILNTYYRARLRELQAKKRSHQKR